MTMWKDSILLLQRLGEMESPTEYAQFAEKNKTSYRTRNRFIHDRLAELNSGRAEKISKEALAKRLGTSNQILNRWERQGVPSIEKAFELAVALEIPYADINDMLVKQMGLRDMYSAYQTSQGYIDVLRYRSQLMEGYPLREDEVISEWIQRVYPYVKGLTDYYKADAKETGKRTYKWLERTVRGSNLAKIHGNSIKNTEDDEDDVWKYDLIINKEREYFKTVCKKIENNCIPNKEETIELGLMFHFTRGQLEEFLDVTGHYPLSGKNIYEGALIVALSYMQNEDPDYFDYDAELSIPYRYRVRLSELMEECLGTLPDTFKAELKECPRWCRFEKKEYYIAKERFALIIAELEKYMLRTWSLLQRRIGDAAFKNSQSVMLEEKLEDILEGWLESFGYESLNPEESAEINRIQVGWSAFISVPENLNCTKREFRDIYKTWLDPLVMEYEARF